MSSFQLLGRKSAEVLSFVISSGIIIVILIILAIDHVQNGHSPYLEIKTTVDQEKVRKSGEHYLLPVKVENLGQRTPSLAIFKVQYEAAEGKMTSNFEIEYLARHEIATVYVSLEEKPESKVKVTLESYQF